MNTIIYDNKIFTWLFLLTLVLLLIPLIAMQYTNQVSWGFMDFLVMGVLLFSISSSFILIARKIARKYRATLGLIFFLTFTYIWVELAVGIFT